MDKKRFELIVKICERAEKFGYNGDRTSLIMDLESADKVFNLRLQDMLDGDDVNFVHDIRGIMDNINRSTFPATDFGFFVPRYAGYTDSTEA
ncbi:MAG: hypothetical protein UIM53_02875 [Acutalibacteraceae bacterium]|nr:hypothetical protein [Acutalibacteraceae bacterium]